MGLAISAVPMAHVVGESHVVGLAILEETRQVTIIMASLTAALAPSLRETSGDVAGI